MENPREIMACFSSEYGEGGGTFGVDGAAVVGVEQVE